MKFLRYILLILFLACISTTQSQEDIEYYENGNTRIKGYLNKKGNKDGNWIILDSLNTDTISLYNYKNGNLKGPFLDHYTGTNRRSKYVTSQLNNYSDLKEETFHVKGFYKKNLLEGPYFEYYENGQKYLEGNYSKGLKDGLFKKYHDNGKIKHIENYTKGVLNGVWKQFYNTGKLREERLYRKGELINSSVIEWFDNGNKKNSTSYIYKNEEKIIHGKTVTYFENGQIRLSSYYEDGKPNGTWEGYYENGKIKYRMIYENFIFKSHTQYDEQGVEKNNSN